MTNSTKTTKRDFFTAIMNTADSNPDTAWDENITSADVVAFCQHEIEKLDKRSATPAKPSKAALVTQRDMETLVEILADAGKPCTVTELVELAADKLEGKVSCQRVTSLMTKAKDNNKVTSSTVKKVSYYQAVIE